MLLGCNPKGCRPGTQVPGLHFVQARWPLDSWHAGGTGGAGLPAERVLVLLDAQPVQRDVGPLLLADVLRDRGLVEPDGGHVVALRPELPVAELVLQVGVPVEHEKRALPLQVPHEARDADLRRDAHQHVDVVGHQVPLDYLHALPLAQLPQYLPQVLAVLVVDDFPPILWGEHDVVLARPLRVRQAVGLLGHGNHLPLGARRPEQSPC